MYGEHSRSPTPPRIKGHDPEYAVNQCDGCRAGKPLDEHGFHRMGRLTEGAYPDYMACQREKYASTTK